MVPPLPFLLLSLENVRKFFLAESEREVREDAQEGEEDNEGDPKYALNPIKRLAEDARDDAGKHARPDEQEGEDDPAIPFGGLKTEMVQYMRHETGEKGRVTE